ncbi:MAG TPA: SDR family oxidoreductase [Bryobacteraceae bacterium]|nr:SDR family oxidoreductase [Bryobacteraceae bacterium]
MTSAGKVLLITGSTGIAAATARLAEAEGARVFTCGLERGETDAFVADLRDPAAAEAACRACLERFGRIDGLFNVAGVSGRRWGDGPLHECSLDGWDLTIEANLRTLFLITRPVLRQMLEQENGGAILNMTSVSAFAPQAAHFGTHAYAAAKGAIASLSRAMAASYAPQGIRVNAIAPGLTRTPMSARAQSDPAVLEYIRSKQPLASGMIEPGDIAATALFLLSDASRMITGQVITLDAGWSVS